MSVKITYRANELVDACEAFFSLNAALHLPLLALFVPDLEAFVIFAYIVRADLVIDDAMQATAPILWRIADINS